MVNVNYILISPMLYIFDVTYSISLGNLEHIPDLGGRRRSKVHILVMRSFSIIAGAGSVYTREGIYTFVRAVQDSCLSL